MIKIAPGQIWERNWATDYHYLPVRAKVLSVSNELIELEIISSALKEIRPVGTFLIAQLNGEDPTTYHMKFGWTLVENKMVN